MSNMTKEEVFKFFHEKQYAGMTLFVADHDYAAARCNILNGLSSGYVLACQAIEKTLKVFI